MISLYNALVLRGREDENASEDKVSQGWGDVWTWTALDADTKLIVSYLVGQRGADWAKAFLEDVASRVSNRIQLTTDGHHVYLDAVESAFGADVDHAMLIELYGNPTNPDTRYSSGEVIGIETKAITMRMSMRRFTHLTSGFSKKLANHQHMLAIYFLYYNYATIHQTLRVTPAMEAGLSDHVWRVGEIVALLDRRSILHGLPRVA